jgi:WhiB family transcriptional regulator, redox-sensing transcriptional regulator
VAVTITDEAIGFVEMLFAPTPAWFDDALCRGVGAEFMFPTRGDRTEHIKAVCEACPVRSECLEHALATGEKFGIWGGHSERERRLMRRARRQAVGRAS